MALGRVSKPIWKAHIVGQRTSDCIESDDGVLLRLFGYMLARFYVCDSVDHTSDLAGLSDCDQRVCLEDNRNGTNMRVSQLIRLLVSANVLDLMGGTEK